MVVLAGQVERGQEVSCLAVHGGAVGDEEDHDPPSTQLGRPVYRSHSRAIASVHRQVASQRRSLEMVDAVTAIYLLLFASHGRILCG